MEDEDILSAVEDVVSAILEVPNAKSASRESVADWDSLNHAEIVFSLEERFRVKFPRDDLFALNNVDDLVVAVKKALSSQSQ